MISQTAEYALRAMIVLLARAEGPLCSAHDVAARAQVPVDYMAKILNALVKSGLVTAQRGRNGGCKASRTAAEIRVLDIVQAVDPIRRIHTCPVGIAAHGTRLCPLHRKLDEAAQCVEEAFASTTMADLLNEDNPSIPLCTSSGNHHVQRLIH
ncbi:MAG TPA: Rrf2 family transcriptional regulator [Bryobacteraceae bacterium]|nr:Rrf2 family transcriptional regulator [Bryobacteraceae bacterium]